MVLEELARQGIGFLSLIVVLAAGARGVWVWGYHYRDCQRERDEWRHIALSGTHLAERSVEIVEQERTKHHYET